MTISGGNLTLNISSLLNGTNATLAIKPNDLISTLLGLSNTLLTGGGEGAAGSSVLLNNGTVLELPIDPIIDAILVNNVIPTSISMTYTVVEGFD